MHCAPPRGPGWRYRAGVSSAAQPPGVTVVRSRRRKKTVSAYREGGQTFVLIPARLSAAEEARWVAEMTRRLERQERRRRPRDPELENRARELSQRYLAGRARPSSVRWVDNQHGRWGSATPSDGTIRLSSRLAGMPHWVIDYVLLHELSHLVIASHSSAFWALVARYPKAERARGYLEGVSAAAGLGITE